MIGYAGVVAARWSIGQFNIFKTLGVDPTARPFLRATRRALRASAALIGGRRRVAGAAGAAAVFAEALAAADE